MSATQAWQEEHDARLRGAQQLILIGSLSGPERLMEVLNETPPIEVLRERYPEVEQFAALMLRELWANRAKGDQAAWRRDSGTSLWNEVQWHSAKLAVAMRDYERGLGEPDSERADKVREYAADTANMAMMLLDTLRLLP